MHFHGFPPQAAQLAEVYWMSLVRDVPFSQYGNHWDTNAAAGKVIRGNLVYMVYVAGTAAFGRFHTLVGDDQWVLVSDQTVLK